MSRIGMILLIAVIANSCYSEAADCSQLADCMSSKHGIIVGRDTAARNAAHQELDLAAATYATWLNRAPPPGVVILDPKRADAFDVVAAGSQSGMFWRLTYGEAVREASGAAGHGAARLDRPGVLAHEICHKYATVAFGAARQRNQALPAMLDELAAVSCETQALRSERLQEFSRHFFNEDTIPWEHFLAAPHPLTGSRAAEEAMRAARLSGRSTLTFTLPPASSLARDVEVFYGQAGAFVEFVRVRSCKGLGAVGSLLLTYDSERGLEAWLRSNGHALCLPTSTRAFAREFQEFMSRI